MPFIKEEEIENIHKTLKPPVVSMYIPAHEPDQARRSIAMREALLMEIAEGLERLRVQGYQIEPLLDRIKHLSNCRSLLEREGGAVAVFISAGAGRIISLPMHMEGDVVIGESADTRPLGPLVSGRAEFFIVVCGNQVSRFLICDENGAAEILLQFPRVRPDGDLGHPIHRLLREVSSLLTDENAPLVFAGPRELHRVFRAVCSYENPYPGILSGDWSRASSARLFRAARSLMRRGGSGTKNPLSMPPLRAQPRLATAG